MHKGHIIFKRLLAVLLGAGLFITAEVHAHAEDVRFVNTLMPQPSQLRLSTGPAKISPEMKTTLHGSSNPLLQQATRRALDRLESMTQVLIDKNLQPTDTATLDIAVEDVTATHPVLQMDESYSLDVQSGKVSLHAKTVFGAMHGLETLLQLVQTQGTDFFFPAVHIADTPRFPWRGLMLDPGRRFLSVEEILRTLDGMAAVKLNVLHWHLTEDQGFRIESKRFPKLHELGSEGQYYTQEQVRQIIQYASARGIRIVPEFDMPGHSTSWFVGYPELAAQPGPYHVEHVNHIFNAVMDPTRDSTYKFLDTFFGEMAVLFPDEYMHIGGDESNGKDWSANPAIVRFMQQHNLKDSKALQAYFNLRVQVLLKKHGKQMVGWDEILQPELAQDVVIQNWHGSEFLINGARQGHRGIFSKPYYLDHMYSAAEMYAADPLPEGSPLSAAEAKLVLGGEACMWGEQIATLTADSRIWPRAAAVAERLWSPMTIRDTEDMYRRLEVTSLRLDALGITHLSTPQRGLRQLAGSDAGAAKLAFFTSLLQPVDFHERGKEQHTSPLTPIGRLVDFTTSDPPSRRLLDAQIHAYLQATDPRMREMHREELMDTFFRWLEVSSDLNTLAANHPLIAEVRVRREELPALASLGIQSIGYLESHTMPSAEWTAAQTGLLSRAAEHKELVDYVVLDSLSVLLNATSRP
ncbi:beta-N-acetylhexosaminidase [Terriglobus saanensis]|uniref:Beta-N-acetylhexosaminidase n=1 Tax=Terriglobus saanensis (strain ATCC BAA-1853 / DSM 23119 / SP1PR4) TaxID=401053 RepID=E8V0X2_TERSS|nr:beta-N-acetylhexosaminidase [Terriglobus saanensis]ADV82263.1 Beta-N-acetylhexosaminidase [Terriglobus saanensis SP1PR4]